MALVGASKKLGEQSGVHELRQAIQLLWPIVERLASPTAAPIAQPVILAVDEAMMDAIYPPEEALKEFAGSSLDDARQAAEIVAIGATFVWNDHLAERFGDMIALPFRPLPRAPLIALCRPRLIAVKTRFDKPYSTLTAVTVVLAHELVHWLAGAVTPGRPWFDELTAQVVSRRLLHGLPDATALVAFHDALARKSPHSYRSHLELGGTAAKTFRAWN